MFSVVVFGSYPKEVLNFEYDHKVSIILFDTVSVGFSVTYPLLSASMFIQNRRV